MGQGHPDITNKVKKDLKPHPKQTKQNTSSIVLLCESLYLFNISNKGHDDTLVCQAGEAWCEYCVSTYVIPA